MVDGWGKMSDAVRARILRVTLGDIVDYVAQARTEAERKAPEGHARTTPDLRCQRKEITIAINTTQGAFEAFVKDSELRLVAFHQRAWDIDKVLQTADSRLAAALIASHAAPPSAILQPPACIPGLFRGDFRRLGRYASPAPRLLWVEVARGRCRAPSTGSTYSDRDSFLTLRTFHLRQHNVAFPSQKDDYDLACHVYTFLRPLKMATCTPREAFTLAASGHPLLHEVVAQDITFFGAS